MTPTLLGRWQTRLFINTALGLPLTVPFFVISIPTGPGALVPFGALAIVTFVGLVLDVGYQQVQKRRWDHDWPTWIQVVAGLIEGLVSWMVLLICVPLWIWMPLVLTLFPLHYTVVWLAGFLFLQGPVYVVFPMWRFRGGRIV